MSKVSSVQKNKNRAKKVKSLSSKRAALKAVIYDRSLPLEDRFSAQVKLSALPRNSAPTRLRNRCEISGRARGYYRKFRMSRIALRELASHGLIPGLTKASW